MLAVALRVTLKIVAEIIEIVPLDEDGPDGPSDDVVSPRWPRWLWLLAVMPLALIAAWVGTHRSTPPQVNGAAPAPRTDPPSSPTLVYLGGALCPVGHTCATDRATSVQITQAFMGMFPIGQATSGLRSFDPATGHAYTERIRGQTRSGVTITLTAQRSVDVGTGDPRRSVLTTTIVPDHMLTLSSERSGWRFYAEVRASDAQQMPLDTVRAWLLDSPLPY